VAIQITVRIQGLFSGFVTIGRYRKWLTDISAAHTDSLDGGTGKTCLGGGMHCPSASSLLMSLTVKEFENRSAFGEVADKNIVGRF